MVTSYSLRLAIIFHIGLLFPACAGELNWAQMKRDIKAANADPKYANSPNQKAKLMAYWADHMTPIATARIAQRKSEPKPNPVSHTSTLSDTLANTSASESATVTQVPYGHWEAILRKDFSDIGVVAAPIDASKATGAAISYSNDRVAKDISWQLQGVGVVGYSYDNGSSLSPDLHFRYGTVGIYGGIDKFTNTNRKPVTPSKDNISDGGVEVGLERTSDYYDWIRVKAGSVTNQLTSKTQFSTTAEWIPVYYPYLIHVPPFFDGLSGQFGVRFDPELFVQYDNTFNYRNILLFSNQSTAVRVGPRIGNYHLDIVRAICCNGSSQGDSHGRRSFQSNLYR